MPSSIEITEDHYMHGHCASFAYALWLAHGKPSNGLIGILSDDLLSSDADEADPDSDEILFDCTHAYLDLPTCEIDVCGARSPQEMAEQLGLASWSLYGPYTPKEFLELFTSYHRPDRPLEASSDEIAKALAFIRMHPTRYA